MPLRCLIIDFNSFFASVEQQFRPELRHQPVAVVPVLADSTCCIAASYEAKAFGITTGTPVHEAKRRCPRIQIVEARHDLYVRYHHRLIAAVENCTHVRQALSIDEMICDLPLNLRSESHVRTLALRIKREIADMVGPHLRCSIGAAPNAFLAKTASDMQKPDGLVILQENDLPHRLHPLELRDLCGIGSHMLARLHRHGIYTVETLCAARRETLRAVWNGIEGERMYDQLRGHVPFRPPTQTTSISHSHVLPPQDRNGPAAFAVLNRLLQKAATRLRCAGFLASGLGLFIRYSREMDWSRDLRFSATGDTLALLRILEVLWQQRPAAPPLAVGVTLFRLVAPGNHTPSLFDPESRHDGLCQAMDKLNRRYGKNTVYFGGAHTARTSAPAPIAFNHIPEIEPERS
jgi:DNA polymerase-4